MSDRHSFSSDNFYVGSDNVQCPTVILSTGKPSIFKQFHICIKNVFSVTLLLQKDNYFYGFQWELLAFL